MSNGEVAAIIFNESRSFSGKDIDAARYNMAHAILNGDAARGSKRPKTAPASANVPKGEQGTYQSCLAAATSARADKDLGVDPTNGAMHFNFRNDASRKSFQRQPISTQVGPLNNSYTGHGLNSKNIYANTYGGHP